MMEELSQFMLLNKAHGEPMLIEEFPCALVGFGKVRREGQLRNVAIYSYDHLVEYVTKQFEELSEDPETDAHEYIELNVLNCYRGTNMPVIVYNGFVEPEE